MRAVELLPHDPAWAERAQEEISMLAAVLGDPLLAAHHIGSTAVSGLHAKPIVDLMVVVTALDALLDHRSAIESLGYRWRGENGLPGRRYFTRDDVDGCRRVHLHVYAEDATDIARHLAFRDHLRADSALAASYDNEKARCQAIHPRDAGAYSACKSGWIAATEARLATVSTNIEE